jgi:hypothetical protein
MNAPNVLQTEPNLHRPAHAMPDTMTPELATVSNVTEDVQPVPKLPPNALPVLKDGTMTPRHVLAQTAPTKLAQHVSLVTQLAARVPEPQPTVEPVLLIESRTHQPALASTGNS